MGTIYNRRIVDVEAFIQEHLDFEIAPPILNEEHHRLQSLFRDRVLRYVRGTGHPDHPELNGIVTPELAASERSDTTLRASLLLSTMSSSSLMPLGSHWKLKVSVLVTRDTSY